LFFLSCWRLKWFFVFLVLRGVIILFTGLREKKGSANKFGLGGISSNDARQKAA
jgi:hypothetical protein